MPLEIKEIQNKTVWSDFLNNHPYNYFLQTWAWGEFQQKGLGKPIFHLGLFERDELKGICLVIEEQSRFGKFAYCPRGPILDWQNQELRTQALQALKDYFANKNYLHLRLDPEVLADDLAIKNAFFEDKFQPTVRSIQVERAWVLDLQDQTEASLLKNMRKNTRYYIKKGQKNALQIEFAQSNSKMEEFVNMLNQMSQRKGFLAVNQDYLFKQFQFLNYDGMIQLASAVYQGKTVAMAMIVYYGKEASYLHAASVVDEMKLEPSYYLQWESIKYAKQLGLKQYNFWGVVSEDKYHPGHPGYGYSNFKKGFGGELRMFLRTQDFVYKPFQYKLFYLQEWYRAKRDKGV